MFPLTPYIILEVPLPLLIVQVLAIDLGMDVPTSLALVMEPLRYLLRIGFTFTALLH